MSTAGDFQIWWSLMLLKNINGRMILLACGEFKSKVYLIGMHKDLKVWTILAPQENCQEGGVGSTNYSRISKGDTDILADG